MKIFTYTPVSETRVACEKVHSRVVHLLDSMNSNFQGEIHDPLNYFDMSRLSKYILLLVPSVTLVC